MVAAPTASAAPVQYVNLGDSYSAGALVPPKRAGFVAQCRQSSRNYAHVIAAARGYLLTDVSCGSAATKHMYLRQLPGTRPQLDALSPATQLVTLMIGGNDDNVFANSVKACVAAFVSAPTTQAPCERRYGDTLARPVLTRTGPAVTAVLRAVHARAPRARVFVVGYPGILPSGGNCLLNPIAPSDFPYLQRLQATLNGVIRAAAAATGTTFVDMSVASRGRDSCAPENVRWIEPLISYGRAAQLHPNAAGEQAMAREVLAAIDQRFR
ncbi:SGNH/GDSL hydrolase family protein [Williamsia sp. CHRR-6]|nr:SGNH/GDSL hydrolase family protein [Williamsia sp. CHRR-6]